MVKISGRFKLKAGLQESLNMRGAKEVVAARDQADPLERIIDHDRQVIARPKLLARDHDVAIEVRLHRLRTVLVRLAVTLLFECQWPANGGGGFWDIPP